MSENAIDSENTSKPAPDTAKPKEHRFGRGYTELTFLPSGAGSKSPPRTSRRFDPDLRQTPANLA
jgi:hypothetical protein